nr:hypothetical protein [Pseudomonadota bacterium]
MDQDNAYKPLPLLVDELRRLHRQRRTGTLFIATEDNQLLRAGLQDGEIISLSFRNRRGADALNPARQIRAGRARFEPGMLMPCHGQQPLPPTPQLLDYLSGGDAPPAAAPPVSGGGLSELQRTVLEEELADAIGPMAAIVCAEHLQ